MRSIILLARHQVGSFVATCVDFATMTALVSGAGASPVAGTIVGASCGALASFTLGRRWIFHARGRAAAPQALRYALASAASLLLNALGEWALTSRASAPYFAARVAVAVVVGVTFNFPMHRYFVFQHPHRAPENAS